MGKLFGRGRLVAWRGGSVWVGRTEDEADFHVHHLIQLSFALSGGTLRLRTPGENWRAYAAALVASQQPHAFEARGELVALVFVEPESSGGRLLRKHYPKGVSALDWDAFREDCSALASAFAANGDDEALAAPARALGARLGVGRPGPAKPLDVRIQRAIDQMRGSLGEEVSLAEIAERVHLSPERFRHLFVDQTGMRFRPYILWLRMETALASIGKGRSITDAAQDGGFADSSHFARTFKRMFGVSAASVQRL